MPEEQYKIEMPSSNIFFEVFVIVAGFILPVLLIPVIKFTAYSEVVEEIAKALVILFLILKMPNHKKKIFFGIVFGILFGLSENFLYLNQIFQFGDLNIFWQRFLWTMPMHIITVLIMIFFGISKKWLLIFGLISAVILHIIFNYFAVSILV